MIPAYTYKQVCHELARAFAGRYTSTPYKVRMVGLLFVRPQSPLARDEILPSLDYFHHRSANEIDFFCAGYGAYWEKRQEMFPDQLVVNSGTYHNWLFSAQWFNKFRHEVEHSSSWQYSGATDLILTNAVYDLSNKTADLDFSKAIVFPLDKMKYNGAIYSVEMFFEDIIRFAEHCSSVDPTSEFISIQGIEIYGRQHSNIALLQKRMDDALRRDDYAGVLHASASIFETMAKDIVGLPSVQQQTLGGFFARYRKDSSLPEELLDYILAIYNDRNQTPLAGHGSTDMPTLSQKQAIVIAEMTKAFVRIEYAQYASSIAAAA